MKKMLSSDEYDPKHAVFIALLAKVKQKWTKNVFVRLTLNYK